MYAHLFGTPKRGFTLYITNGADLDTEPLHFATKELAKAHAKAVGASPWNYTR